jgi:hypothetical protein
MDVGFLPKPLSGLLSPIIWAAISTVSGFYFFYRGFVLLSRERLILNTPRSTIRGAALGLVEVCGKATGPYTLISPLSEQDCYFYRAVAWRSEDPVGASGWKKAAEECLCTPLFLDDGTGRLLLNPRGAELDLAASLARENTDSAFPSSGVAGGMYHFLARHGVSIADSVKVEESCILPGETIFALGTVCENPVLSTDEDPPATMFGPPGSDFVSAPAADLQRRGSFDFLHLPEVNKLPPGPGAFETGQFDLQPSVVLMKGPSRDPFIISWRSQREVVLVLDWKARVYIWGGAALTLVCLWYLVNHFR